MESPPRTLSWSLWSLGLMLQAGCGSCSASRTLPISEATALEAGAMARESISERLPDAGETPGVPYGFWGLNGYLNPEGLSSVKARLGLRVVQSASTDPEWTTGYLLPLMREQKLKLMLRLTGDHPRYTNAAGDFDLDAWKARLDHWQAVDLRPFITDGTLAGHMLLDDIANFKGRDPDAADLDEMARYSRVRLPGLLTFVRERATDMPEPLDGRYHELDAIVNQYKSQHGDVEDFAKEEAARARALDLGIINGLNIANGGNGSSGQPGWAEGKWAMSAAEIEADGSTLATVPGLGMFLNWEYDGEERWSDGSIGSAWFDRPEIQSALLRLGEQVSAQPGAPLRREDSAD